VAVDHLERWFRDGDLWLCDSPKLKKQLFEYQEKISKSNELVYGGSGRHDDYVQVLMTAAMAVDERRIPLVKAPPTGEQPTHKQTYLKQRELKKTDKPKSWWTRR
jgi:hypothetical protein